MTETDLFQEPDDATPLDPALRDDLIQTWVTTRADLNEAEEDNIVKGAAWARRRRGGAEALLNEDFAKSLHKQMFGEVWKWAGTQSVLWKYTFTAMVESTTAASPPIAHPTRPV